jgi:hypothetical protein
MFRLRDLNFDPVLELVTLYNDPSTNVEGKIKIACELMQYCYPKLASLKIR